MMLACMQKQISPKLERRIGADFGSMIQQSSSYQLFSWEQELKNQKTLEKSAQQSIQQFMQNPQNYVFGADVRCRLRPDHALVLKENETIYKILLSKNGNCPKLRFLSAGNAAVLSLRPKAYKKLQALIQSSAN